MAVYKNLVKKISISPDKKTKQKAYLKKGSLAIVDQGQSLIGGYTDDVNMAVECDLPVIVFGDHTRAVKYITFPFGAGADGIKILQPKENVLPLFLYYATQYIVAKMPDRGYARHYQYVEKENLTVPSIPEQQRIVSRIEELFSSLDNAVETLRKTKEQLTVYRQAVLKEAFEGEYKKVPLSDISMVISGYAFKSKKYEPNGKYVVVKIGNVKERRFDFSRDLTRTNEVDDGILERYLLQEGDCLITQTGTRGKRDYGFVSLITNQHNFLLNQRVAALRFNKEVALPQFFQYYLSSPDYRDKFFNYETGNVGQGNVGIKALSEPLVVLPSIEEQRMIIQKIEARLSMCDNIEQTVSATLSQAEAMRQSILKEAFEGRLV